MENKKPTSVIINGQEYLDSRPKLCKKLDISESTVIYWEDKGKNIQEAIEMALKAKSEMNLRERTIFNQKFKNLAEACKDRGVNLNKISIKTIQGRVRKGMTPEEAFKMPLKKLLHKNLEVFLPNGSVIKAQSVRGIIKEFELAGYTSPPESTVVSRLNKGETIKSALGLTTRTWLLEKQSDLTYFIDQGYKLIGELRHEGKPVIFHSTKEIYPSAKLCAKAFSEAYKFPYYTVYDKLREGTSPDEVIEYFKTIYKGKK
jgi:hypothetical protein